MSWVRIMSCLGCLFVVSQLYMYNPFVYSVQTNQQCFDSTFNWHKFTAPLYRILSIAVKGEEKDLGILPLKGPSNSPTVTGPSRQRKAITDSGRDGGRRKRGGRRGERGKRSSSGGMTTDDIVNATSIELVQAHRQSHLYAYAV